MRGLRSLGGMSLGVVLFLSGCMVQPLQLSQIKVPGSQIVPINPYLTPTGPAPHSTSTPPVKPAATSTATPPVTPVVTPISTQTPPSDGGGDGSTQTTACTPKTGLTTLDDQILSDGKEVKLKGVNWAGFQVSSSMRQSMVDGLWQMPGSITVDFATVMSRMKALGFNAVRIPFGFQTLDLPVINEMVRTCTISSNADLVKNVTNPKRPGTGNPFSMLVTPPIVNKVCNSYLPSDKVTPRYVYVVSLFARNCFYVLVDNHFRSGEEDFFKLKGPDAWVSRWVELVTELSKDPAIKNRLMIDPLNEPGFGGLTWPQIAPAYLSLMSKVYAINPGVLFFLEGTGQLNISNMGDGFATDASVFSKNPSMDNPTEFFKTIVAAPYAKQIVLAPHVYPPSVTHTGRKGAALWQNLNDSFGRYTKKGFCTNGKCKRFPIAIGEFGSLFKDQADIDFLNDLASYLNNTGPAKDNQHNPINNWFYWTWNNNSGDTGGIVKDNWVDIEWNKIDWLTDHLGLKPWYKK